MMQRAANAALKCCCRTLHSQTGASLSGIENGVALNALRISSKVLRDAIAEAGPTAPGRMSYRCYIMSHHCTSEACRLALS